MEDLSPAEYSRLKAEEKLRYLNYLFGDDSAVEDYDLDSDDEDYVPNTERPEVSDCEEFVENRESEAESDKDDDESTENVATSKESSQSTKAFIARDKTLWPKTPPIQHQTPSRNILWKKCGPDKSTETLSIMETFKRFVTAEMVGLIVHHTNKKASTVCDAYNKQNPSKKAMPWRKLTIQEFYTFLGILITSGANNSNTDHISDMWKSTSYPLYRAAMGINRFWTILRFIRFDDANTRQDRLKEDKVAPIRDIWVMLNANLSALYKPTGCFTIDKQLCPFRGRTRFTQYIPSKPAKYGIKVWYICVAENSYPLHGEIYTGKSSTGCETHQGERVVKDLAELYKGFKTVQNYNKTKVGVDTMLARYTTHRRTNRWPLAFFFNILDIASLASYIIYYENNKMLKKRTNERRLFLRQLGEELCMPTIEDRSQNVLIMRNFTTKIAIDCIYGKPIRSACTATTSTESTQQTDSTGRKVVVGSCYICHQDVFKKRRKTRKVCTECHKPVCDEHSKAK